MNDTRTSVVVGAGAAVVAGSLWAPWYAIDFGPDRDGIARHPHHAHDQRR